VLPRFTSGNYPFVSLCRHIGPHNEMDVLVRDSLHRPTPLVDTMGVMLDLTYRDLCSDTAIKLKIILKK